MTAKTDNKVKILDENYKIKNEEKIIEVIKEEKRNKNYHPSFIEKIIKALKLEFSRTNGNFSDLDLEEWLEPNGICFQFAKRANIERTQLRKYFDEFKKIKISLKGSRKDEVLPDDVRIKLVSLIPKFAYAKGRKLIGDDVYEFFSFSLKKLKEGKVKDFYVFEQILEAILAYHTFLKPTK